MNLPDVLRARRAAAMAERVVAIEHAAGGAFVRRPRAPPGQRYVYAGLWFGRAGTCAVFRLVETPDTPDRATEMHIAV